MSKKGYIKPYRIVAAYDSETTNISRLGAEVRAFPIVHQIGYITDVDISEITADNVESLVSIDMVRRTYELYDLLDELILAGSAMQFVPVVMVHNLGFDMQGLSAWLSEKEVKVLAKSTTKPITLTALDDNGSPSLVLWDTLGFFGKPLETMGSECGYPKLVGAWDYHLIRTPETPLTPREVEYAEHDIYTLFCYLGYYLRSNPLIKEDDLAKSVMTKTGAVRAKRKALFDGKRGKGTRQNVGRFWHYENKVNKPQTDDFLYTMQAVTRGGLTFCASRTASVPYMLKYSEYVIAGYDATSQHPAQMVSHFYPEKFLEADMSVLALDIELVRMTTINDLLERWERPFPVAFNACIRFKNLRMKPGTVFEKNGISPLAWARTQNIPFEADDENQSATEFKNDMQKKGYKDRATGGKNMFGKLFEAREADLWLTELGLWEVCQVFDWDSAEPISGYSTMKYARPTDMSMLSVMYFYEQKDIFKEFKDSYENREEIKDVELLYKSVPKSLAEQMESGEASDVDVKAYYQLVKADLNALFGIEATNEAKQDMYLGDEGIELAEVRGIEDLPKSPKAWYQYGQRIVGWSRIAQIVVMMLADGIVESIINGDTDSIKTLIRRDRVTELDEKLLTFGKAIDRARERVTQRIRRQYPSSYVEMPKIGYYEREFEVDNFCASWNKSYCIQKYDKKIGKMRFDFVVAGINTEARYRADNDEYFNNSYNDLADYLYEHGWKFDEICNLLLGYNVTIGASIIKNNGRKIPKWGNHFVEEVTDYQGVTAFVEEPAALALYAASKTIGNIENEDNLINCRIAKENNPQINDIPVILDWEPYKEPKIIYLEE